MIKKFHNILLVLIMAVSFVAICGLTVFADAIKIELTGDREVNNLTELTTWNTFESDGLNLHLNGHTLTITGDMSYTLPRLNIVGDGGTINFTNAKHSSPVFNLVKDDLNYKGDFYFTIHDVTIKNIVAPQLFHIGCVKGIAGFSYFDVNNLSVVNGTFTENGGALFIDDTYRNVTRVRVNNSDFVNITSKGDGAAIYLKKFQGHMDGDYVELNGSSFVNCKSGGAGGAICCEQGKAIIGSTSSNVNDKTVFYNCHAYNGGGAIRGYGDYITVQNAIFAENSTDATHYGGGAIMLDDDYCKVNNCTFFYNHANQGYGGALYMNDSDDEIHDCLFSNNNAYPGCGNDIYYPPKTVSGCEFYGYSSSNSFKSGYSVSDTSNKIETSWVVPLSDVNYDSSGKLKNGSEANPIILKNAVDLAALAADIAADGKTYNNKFYKLDADIPNAFLRIALFDGELDFAGHTIRTKLTETFFDKGSPLTINPQVINVLGELEYYTDSENANYYDYSNGSPVSKNVRADRITGSRDSLDLTNKTYVVVGKLNISERIKVSGESRLIFAAGAELNANNGIDLPEGSTLSLYSQDLNNKGKVSSICQKQLGAGIGGNYAAKKRDYKIFDTNDICPAYLGTGMGTLNINAVDVTAKGNGGAGIGGGQGTPVKANNSTVSEFAGNGGDGGTLNIYNSTVNVEGKGGRDIGGGDGGNSVCKDRFYCAGAGGGAGATVNLFSGEIKATNAGIGGGNAGSDEHGSCSEYYCPAHHSDLVYEGGNGGVLNIANGKVRANTIRGGYGSPSVAQYSHGIIDWPGAKGGAATVLNVADGLYVRTGNNADNLGPAVLATADTLKDVAKKFCFIGTHTHKYKTVYKWTEKHTVCTAYKTCESCGYVESSKIAKTIEYRVIESKVEGETEGEAESVVSTEYTATFEDGEQTTELIEREPEVPQDEGQTESGEMGNLASIFSSGSIWIVLVIGLAAVVGVAVLAIKKRD